MLRFTHGLHKFWVGIHPTVGIVVFDPRVQQGLSKVWVRLFVIDKSCYSEFVKTNVRKALKKKKVW
jgi:hypothetical protein